MRRNGSNLSQKLNNLLFFLGGMLAVILVAILVIGIQTKAQNAGKSYDSSSNGDSGDSNISANTSSGELNDDYEEKWQEGVISYNGKNYKYNPNLKIYLIMGIDKEGAVTQAEDGVSGGQSDAMFLLVVDAENEQVKLISINRNTMTKIAMYDKDGNEVGETTAQICTQHGFGDGMKLSCSRTVTAVANLFYNLPIDGYFALNMDGIGPLNDAIGGVEVEVLDDLDYPNRDVKLKKGDTVTLKGNEAYCYLRGRDINDFDSATDRLRRQEQYIVNFLNKLKSQSYGSAVLAEDMYSAVEDYLVTDLDFETLADSLVDYDFSEDEMYTIPGKTSQGEEFEEFNVDEDEFYDMIINIFYNEVEEE